MVYGLVPKDGTLDDLIERKTKELAIRIVSRTSNSMKLYYQENAKECLKKPFTISQQIAHLQQTGLQITNSPLAEKYLTKYAIIGWESIGT